MEFINARLINNVYVNGDFFLENIYYIDLNNNYLIQKYDFIYCSYFSVEILEVVGKYIIDYLVDW